MKEENGISGDKPVKETEITINTMEVRPQAVLDLWDVYAPGTVNCDAQTSDE